MKFLWCCNYNCVAIFNNLTVSVITTVVAMFNNLTVSAITTVVAVFNNLTMSLQVLRGGARVWLQS
jgi:hypothetical protein